MPENRQLTSNLSGFSTNGRMETQTLEIPLPGQTITSLSLTLSAAGVMLAITSTIKQPQRRAQSGSQYDGRAAFFSAQEDMEKATRNLDQHQLQL